MVEQPSGTVTFLFTDIEGSTRLLHELGPERYREALDTHRRALRDVFERHSGYEVDYEGDSFFVAFADATAAVNAAAEAQAALADGLIRVRMGLHTGTPLLDPPKYIGSDVHLAARVMAVGHGGQALLTAATRELVDTDLVELGEHRMKDIEQAVPLFQLGHDSFPPLRTISNTNLPRPASSFVGREREVAELVALVSDGARLVTVSGPGGTGKTRLAIEAATEALPGFKAGVFWIGLATLSDAALVTDTITQTLGATDGLAEHIADREILLLLDNFEQVVAAAPQLSSLLAACPNLRLLVTSRELLRVQGEVEYPVPPLASAEAVQLFCTRSRLRPSDKVTELCRRLDDLPLAVELAAARASVLSPAQILDRLSQRLDLLKSGRDADPRQQTLRATIEWSHDLLSAEEKLLFARLAVFAGGCTLAAAEEVLEADLDTLQALVDKSLVRHTNERFWMLETIREYALESLGNDEMLADAHADYFLALAEDADSKLRSSEGSHWLDVLDPEQPNLRAALDWYRRRDAPERELRLAAALRDFWGYRGSIVEAERRLREAVERAGDALPHKQGLALHAASFYAWQLGDLETAEELGQRLLELARWLGEALPEISAISNLAHVALTRGHLRRARELYDEAILVSRKAQLPRQLAVSLLNRGDFALFEDDYELATATCQESIAVAREAAEPMLVAAAMTNLGHAQLKLGDPAAGLASVSEALGVSATNGIDNDVSTQLILVAALAAAFDRASAGAHSLGLSSQLSERLGIVREPTEQKLYDETELKLREALGDAAYETEHAAGRRLAVEDALAIARDLA